MNKIYIFLILSVFLALTAGCGSQKAELEEFDREIYTPGYASGFRMLGAEGRESVLIESTDPWQGADSVVRRLFIVRGDEDVPEGYDGKVIHDSVSRIVAMSSTHIAMLDAIGAVDCVVGVSGKDFITNPTLRSRGDSVGDVGYDGNIDYELMVALQPDLVLLYGTNGASGMERKLDELDIPYMYIGDYLEESPLGKAEWMVPLGDVTGRRKEAEERIATIVGNYNSLLEKVKSSDDRPAVMLNAPYGDAWFLPPRDSYMARLIQDAGGEYLGRDNLSSSSVPVDREKAFLMSDRADIWLNAGSFNTLGELSRALPQWGDLKVVRNGMVYNNTARQTGGGGNDFFESGTVNPDVILADLVEIFHPSLMKDRELVYYKRLD